MALSHWSLRSRILVVSIAIPTLVVGVLFILYALQSQERAREAFQERARNLVVLAEGVREGMEEKWTLGVFQTNIVSDWGRIANDASRSQGERDESYERLMQTVPIVSSMRMLKSKAADLGYEFKVPNFEEGLRNRANSPDERELAVLTELRSRVDADRDGLRKDPNYLRIRRI